MHSAAINVRERLSSHVSVASNDRDKVRQLRIVRCTLSLKQTEQLGIGQLQHPCERGALRRIEFGIAPLDEPQQQQVQLEQPAATAPTRARELSVAHTSRFTSARRISLIARDGFSPLGHTSAQFMIVWHRNNL